MPPKKEAPVSRSTAIALDLAEQGLVPDGLLRYGIRNLLRARLAELGCNEADMAAASAQNFFDDLRGAELAPEPDQANAQHYELPAAFFETVLGAHRKYSCGYWPPGVRSLDEAEAAALEVTCERAGLTDGQQVLELGCGWGALSLWMASRYPGSQITALSNSHSQRAYIEAQTRARGIRNLHVVTRDINDFDTKQRFDRIVSVEMFEHLRNWPRAFARVGRWLNVGGRFFLHVFVHRGPPYLFVDRDASDWMTRHFFAGGMMPSDDLALHCQDDLRLLRRWRWNGRHYQRTALAWLERLDARRDDLMPLLAQTYSPANAGRWWRRWRLFFLSVSELFGHEAGQRWWVSHYLFERRS